MTQNLYHRVIELYSSPYYTILYHYSIVVLYCILDLPATYASPRIAYVAHYYVTTLLWPGTYDGNASAKY